MNRFFLLSALTLGAALSFAKPAEAVRVEGTIELAALEAVKDPGALAQVRVCGPSQRVEPRKDVTLFLETVMAGLNRQPDSIPEVRFTGLEFVPSVNVCAAVDGKLRFVNDAKAPIHIMVGEQRFGPIPPGEGLDYACQAQSTPMPLSVDEWKHARGVLYLRSVGLPVALQADGKFSVDVQIRGSYKLWVLAAEGPVLSQDVEVGDRTVRLKLVDPKLNKVED